ncbi:MAG: TIGR04076 family protein [Euryarchaeota archaeon]|nr:TIGR04076 family protein [Euryarchaeota archaeon]
MSDKSKLNSFKLYRLEIKVKEIRGNCPVFKEGDKITIEEPKLILKETDAFCIHAFGSMLSMLVPLSRGIEPKEVGLCKEGDIGYLQCLDPGKEFTGGGTVIFQIKRTVLKQELLNKIKKER